MNKLTRILFLSGGVMLFSAAESKAQLVLAKRPTHVGVAFAKPPRPSNRHVWVSSEWVEVGPTYGERPGHWDIPPRADAIWVPGHWVNRKGGYSWYPGRWK